VDSVLNVDPSLSRADYQRLYSGPRESLPQEMQRSLSISAGDHIMRLYLVTNQPPTSDQARTIVNAV
jgi:hypothetical protein